ncbi:hypothetical protein SH661x_000441 [Planctomicrobium sp. SH661]|uniref:hypothetical protein n=1 Tax=Planctomicrobium sp. SH661 TaxID=3448124 RepID=UPI003F5CA32B
MRDRLNLSTSRRAQGTCRGAVQTATQVSLGTALVFASTLLIGCGQKSASPTPAQTPAASPTTQNAAPANPAAVAVNTPAATVDPKHKETKWIGTIPYDVFYDQPLEIATDTTVIGGAAPTAIASTTTSPPVMTPAAASETPMASSPAVSPSTGGSGVNWGEVIPMPLLVEEVKQLRTSLTGNLQTVATFNKSQKAIALDGAMLTAMAAVAAAHPENVSWKPNAHFVRDLAFQINANSAGSGREPYGKTKEPFDKILVVLDGGKPPEMESPDVVPFAESVYVADMMKRIEASFNKLKANINTDARLKEDPAGTEREMRVLLLLATMMEDASYDSADQQAYQDFLKRFTDGARAGIVSIQTGSLDGFQAALNQIQTTCAECHQQYRGSEAGF